MGTDNGCVGYVGAVGIDGSAGSNINSLRGSVHVAVRDVVVKRYHQTISFSQRRAADTDNLHRVPAQADYQRTACCADPTLPHLHTHMGRAMSAGQPASALRTALSSSHYNYSSNPITKCRQRHANAIHLTLLTRSLQHSSALEPMSNEAVAGRLTTSTNMA